MAKNVYTYYRNRLTKMAGGSKSLCLSSILPQNACDIGKLLSGREKRISEFTDFLRSPDRTASFTLISKRDKKELLDISYGYDEKSGSITNLANSEKAHRVAKMNAKRHREEIKRAVNEELSTIKAIKSNCEDIEKETGKNELYIGYPFVFGTLEYSGSASLVKSPLLLFPIRIEISDDETVILKHDTAEKVLINPSFISAYSYVKKIDTVALRLDFDSINHFQTLKSIISYLAHNNVFVEFSDSKNLFSYSKFKEPAGNNTFSVRHAAVLSRFSLSQHLYNDYMALESTNVTNTSIDLLTEDVVQHKSIISRIIGIFNSIIEKQNTEKLSTYTLKALDIRQYKAVSMVSGEKSFVINTPPFTGSATVSAEMIANAVCNKKRVLLVSDKKMALDAIYGALGGLREQCIYINDESAERDAFYNKLRSAHKESLNTPPIDFPALDAAHKRLCDEIIKEENRLKNYFNEMNALRPFGLSLSEMYSATSPITPGSKSLEIYNSLILQKSDIASLDYPTLKNAIDEISGADLANRYFDFMTEKTKNPIYGYMLTDIDEKAADELKLITEELSKDGLFTYDVVKLSNFKKALACYAEIGDTSIFEKKANLPRLARRIKKQLPTSYKEEFQEEFLDTLPALHSAARKFAPIKNFLTTDGYVDSISNILSGNTNYLSMLCDALCGYKKMQEQEKLFASKDRTVISVLDFAIANSGDRQSFLEVIDKIIPLRIYHEITKYEKSEKDFLDSIPNIAETREKIARTSAEARQIAGELSSVLHVNGYSSQYLQIKDKDKYLADINCENTRLSIKRLTEQYENLIFSLFPIWLLTPDNVSGILPLKKDLFDLVIFDGASQMFIEEAIPTIYRAKMIAVLGDGKQIHTSRVFMRRMLGNDTDGEGGEIVGRLATKSLYDIAANKLPTSNLTYHYGTEKDELINFSNHAFYSSELVVAPKTKKRQRHRPIELYNVAGSVDNGCCENEAREVIRLLSELAKKRGTRNSLGIISFTAEQRDLIASLLEKEMNESEELCRFIEKEKERTIDGEDASFFIKTVENTQGERRDTIILSPAISANNATRPSPSAKNSEFDLETSINVAITRAKQKFILVSGIVPDDLLRTDIKEINTYKRFLEYVKATSSGARQDVETILSDMDGYTEKKNTRISSHPTVSESITDKLTRMGYSVVPHPGGKASAISLAIYDERRDRYLIGIILDEDARCHSDSIPEREISYPEYLEKMGWSILRITSREWWCDHKKVLNSIIAIVEYNREDLSE